MAGVGLRRTRENYDVPGLSSRELHSVDIWFSSEVNRRGIWVIYIHGGAWRDPEVDSLSFEPVVAALSQSPLNAKIAGFASINYRLSPYPSHPTNPSSPDDFSRNAFYPDHLNDVENALRYLDKKYDISRRYLLAGHSAGATLAFELRSGLESALPVPIGVLGVAGIYNFEAFLEAHSQIPAYRQFMENAFPNREFWEMAAPYTNREPGLALWETSRAVIIAHSKDDELIEKKQSTFMVERANMTPITKEKTYFLETKGKHDEIWSSGSILAELIVESVRLAGL